MNNILILILSLFIVGCGNIQEMNSGLGIDTEVNQVIKQKELENPHLVFKENKDIQDNTLHTLIQNEEDTSAINTGLYKHNTNNAIIILRCDSKYATLHLKECI